MELTSLWKLFLYPTQKNELDFWEKLAVNLFLNKLPNWRLPYKPAGLMTLAKPNLYDTNYPHCGFVE